MKSNKAAMRFNPYITLVLIVFGLGACDSYTQDDYDPEYVVEAYLVATESLPQIRFSQTAPIDAPYTFEAYAVEGAFVVVNLLDASGAVEQSFPYRQVEKGIYEPVQPHTVLPLRRYALEIQPQGTSTLVRSSTLVPGPFTMTQSNADTVTYQSPTQLEANVTISEYPERDQAVYIFTVEAQDTVNYDLTPFYDALVDDDSDFERGDLVRNSSPISNESNFDKNPDGTLTLRLPWVAVAFFGPNKIIAQAIDNNIYDFKRSQMGSGTTSPGEMDNLIDHVEGGRGIFGSMARAETFVFVEEPQAP
jgi:hypothetical protein